MQVRSDQIGSKAKPASQPSSLALRDGRVGRVGRVGQGDLTLERAGGRQWRLGNGHGCVDGNEDGDGHGDGDDEDEGRQTDRQTDRQIDRQTGRQVDR